MASILKVRLIELGRSLSWVCQCLRQLDHVAAQRVRRTHQWIAFNNRIWPSGRLGALLLELMSKLTLIARLRRGHLLFGATAVVGSQTVQPVRSDGAEKSLGEFTITDEMMTSHTQDIDYVHFLKATTLTCKSCGKRHLISCPVEDINYCNCSKKVQSAYGLQTQDTAWTPFLERKDILVWRQEHPEQKGRFAYKMYGRFDDVTALEFLEVQMDVSEFRLSWDKSTAQCYVIDEHRGNPESNVTQVYYWEVNWPRFFCNRDYVCGRRAQFYEDKNMIVVYSKSTEHPTCPPKSKNFRVEDYWSVLTIKPFSSFDKLGIEFSLTAYENPGVSMPSSVTTWVAIRAMPDFMSNLRQACIELRKWKSNEQPEKDTIKHPSSKEPSYMETPQYRVTQNVSTAYA